MSLEKTVSFPRVVENTTTRLSPWVTLSNKHVVRKEGGEDAIFHSLQQSDYVTVFAVRADGLIPLVRQFRPAVEQFTLELPGGLLDRDEEPVSVAISEIFEETGHRVVGKLELLGCLNPDTGRLENRFWTYFAEVSTEIDDNWVPESGIEPVLVSRHELREMIIDGRFNHALHIALIGLALTKRLFSWDM